MRPAERARTGTESPSAATVPDIPTVPAAWLYEALAGILGTLGTVATTTTTTAGHTGLYGQIGRNLASHIAIPRRGPRHIAIRRCDLAIYAGIDVSGSIELIPEGPYNLTSTLRPRHMMH